MSEPAVRAATGADIARLVSMCGRFHEQSGFPGSVDPIAMYRLLRELIYSPSGVLLVLEIDGSVEGMAAAVLCPQFYNPSEITGQELFWWCEEGKRGYGLRLLDELEAAVAAAGAHTITMGHLGADDPRVERVYRRRGYTPCETLWVRRL